MSNEKYVPRGKNFETDRDFVFNLYEGMGKAAGSKYLDATSIRDSEESKKLLGIEPGTTAAHGFNSGWVKAH